LAKEYVLKSEEELAAIAEAQRLRDGDTVTKLLAFFCGQKQEPGKGGPGDLERGGS
jgi:hypothetical protein